MADSGDIDAVRLRIRDISASTSVLMDDVDDAVDTAITQASYEYSRHKPYIGVVDVTGNGTPFYAVSNLTGYVDDWSRVTRIEYPADDVDSTHQPLYLDPVSDWEEYRTAATRYIFLIARSPSASETIRFWYTIPHVMDGSVDDTVENMDRPFVLDLAASYVCLMLAAEAAQSTDPDLPSESAAQSGQSPLDMAAKRFRQNYERHIGLGDNESPAPPASVAVTDWDPKAEHRRGVPYVGRSWLTHNSRR